MDNLQLSYSFGRIDKSLDLQISAMVQNVFTVTKYKGVDPEVNFNGLTPGIDYTSGYPTTRTFTLGVKIGF